MSAILEAMSTRVRATFAFALLAAASASVPARGDDAQDAVDFIRHKDYFGNCRPADNIYDSAGCCGTPGYRGCALAPLCVTPPKSNLLRGFGCNLPDPDCSDGLVARAMIGTGNTF